MAPEQNGHRRREQGFSWAQQHRCLLTKANLVTAAAEHSVCQWQRPVQGLQCGTTPQVTSRLLRCRMVMLELLITGGAVFCSCWNRFLLWLSICFLCCNASAKPTFCEWNVLFTVIAWHTFSLPNKELICTKKSVPVGPWSGLFWSYHIPHLPRAVGLIRWWSNLY